MRKELPEAIQFELPYNDALELMNIAGRVEIMVNYDWNDIQRMETKAKVDMLRMIEIIKECFSKE